MKHKRIILALLGLAIGVASIWAMVQSQQPERPEVTSKESIEVGNFETILIGKGGAPKWSPDGEKLAFMCGGGWLCWAPADGKGEIKKITQMLPGAYNVWFDWIDSTELITREMKNFRLNGGLQYIFRIKTATLDERESLLLMDSSATHSRPGKTIRITPYKIWRDGTISYEQIEYTRVGKDFGKSSSVKILKKGTLEIEDLRKEPRPVTVSAGGPFGVIWLKSDDGTIEKQVTKDGWGYGFLQLSPDGTKIACKNASGDIVVLDLEGNRIGNLGRGIIISEGPFGNWSPDSKQIAYHLSVSGGEDGQFTVASELYIANCDGSDKIQITDTPDEFEMNPVWSPDGTRIACSSFNTGNIFVIKIK